MYKFFAGFFQNKLKSMVWIDFQVFVILGTIFYLKYHGQKIDFFGLFKLDWFVYFILFSTLIESSFLAYYSKVLGFAKSGKVNKVKTNFDIQAEEFKKKEKAKIDQKIKTLKKEIDELNSLPETQKTVDIKIKIASLKYKMLVLEEKKIDLDIGE